ncbi:unnamed protein product [Cladocopium goreaui]|uniref:Uncharacterized protein n=1 Tax=Cladocopium goreaui TaxID=2562237 RepID=A0A9P1CXT9_9DINO|nr:unnamed protein product [Cladocopium goreaui]
MWIRFLEPLLLSLVNSPYRIAPGFAEWVLFGLLCFSAGLVVGSLGTALLCSQRLRRLVLNILVEGLTAYDRPPANLREDRLAGYRVHVGGDPEAEREPEREEEQRADPDNIPEKLKTLRSAVDTAEWDWLVGQLSDRCFAAIPVFKRSKGVLVAIPQAAISSDDLEAGYVGEDLPDLGMDAILAQLENLATAVNGLQGDVNALKQDRPRGSGEVAEPEGEEVPGGEATEDLDTLLKLALIKMVHRDSNKKTKKRHLGLHVESSDSEEAEDPLRRLSGAKGTILQERLRSSMTASPQEYVQAIELMASSPLGKGTPDNNTMEKYVREELPIGTDRNLGYMAWLLVKAAGPLKAGKPQHAHLLILLGLASLEQFKLDSNWSAAWRVTNLNLPPFMEWQVRSGTVTQLRNDFAHSRLLHPTWAAAISARMRDEEVLVKRRGPSKTPNDLDRKDQKGKGKGNNSGSQKETQQ